MLKPKTETEDLLLSITKNCELLIEQTNRKAEKKTFEVKLTKPRETIHFKPPIAIEGSSTVGLVSLQVYISIINIAEENKNF